jgi:predicted oxidoreductase (fatty acid repression mutant protein)
MIAYTMDGPDKRKATVAFEDVFESAEVTVTFDPEDENPIAMQKAGWQAILDNFKKYAEHLK